MIDDRKMDFAQPALLDFPNTVGPDGQRWAPGTVVDLWSIHPSSGEFKDVSDMQVSADGQRVETTSGGVVNSSWHFWAPQPTEPNLKPDSDKCDECDKKGSANSEVNLHSGEITETHALPTYDSLGQSRGVTLVYNSLDADPRPILHVGYDDIDPNIISVPSARKVVARAAVNVNGVDIVSSDWRVPACDQRWPARVHGRLLYRFGGSGAGHAAARQHRLQSVRRWLGHGGLAGDRHGRRGLHHTD
jgi:hypothetical protein